MKSIIKKAIFLLIFASSTCVFSQLRINELDCDTPSVDDKEFIELKSATPNFTITNYVLVFFNGTGTNANNSYYLINLNGMITDSNGILLLGNNLVSPVPDHVFTNSIIQNGPDGVGLYQGTPADFPLNTIATSTNLIDALVYDTSDPQIPTLQSLLNVTVQINENANGQQTTQSIQRKNDLTWEVKNPTPGANNDGSGVTFNNVSIVVNTANKTEGQSFPLTFTTQTNITSPLTFSFTLDNGTFNSNDYSNLTTVTIPTGSNTATITINLVDDISDEGDEEMKITFGVLPFGFKRANDNVIIRVVDNDFTSSGFGTPLNPTFGIVSSTAPSGYYSSLEGLSGATLKQAVQDIIANPNIVHAHSYGDVTDILKKADQNPLNSNQVWLMYVEYPYAKLDFQVGSSNVNTWNREHIYPQSRGGFSNGTSDTADGINIWLPTSANDILAGHGDAHHLRAEYGPENTLRSNKDYGLGDYNGPTNTAGSWKGDVARSVFYMAVRYNGLSVVNGNPADTTVGQLGDLETLLQWNMQDASDDFEMNRNNFIYTWQVNRNPFIDHPNLANYIFGANFGQPWFSNLTTSNFNDSKIVLYPNPNQNQFIISGADQNTTVTIFNILGNVVFSDTFSFEKQFQTNLQSGVYIAKIDSNGTITKRKIIVK
ncbi:MAG: hypothetical protein ACI9XR_001344 [Flavobacterium sp.]|jgi:hypothetical protein